MDDGDDRGDADLIGALPGRAGRWSLDGSSFAYVDVREARTDLFLREPSGEEVRLTDDDLVEDLPRWSRDGTRLLFSASVPNRDLWMLELPASDPWSDVSEAAPSLAERSGDEAPRSPP